MLFSFEADIFRWAASASQTAFSYTSTGSKKISPALSLICGRDENILSYANTDCFNNSIVCYPADTIFLLTAHFLALFNELIVNNQKIWDPCYIFDYDDSQIFTIKVHDVQRVQPN